jgi:sulfonate transport system ATP-binding protein
MIENGALALDRPIRLQRPRRCGSVDLALLEEKVLEQLLRETITSPEYAI